MWIVQLALRRPYTFVVMALLIAIIELAIAQINSITGSIVRFLPPGIFRAPQ